MILNDITRNQAQLSSAERQRQNYHYLERARAIVPLIKSRSAEIEQGGAITPDVEAAMRDAEVFWLLLHKEFGGCEVDITTYINILDEISYADGSTGWVLLATSASTSFAGMFCGPKAIDALFGGKRRAVIAGMPGPAGTSVEIPGGLRGGGRFSFASGFHQADWISGGLTVLENGIPRRRPNGTLESHFCLVPKETVVPLGNWDVLGLKATCSIDYEIPETDFDMDFAPDMYLVKPYGDGLHTLGSQPLSCAGHAGWALGSMRRALEELVPYVSNKGRRGYPGHIGEHPHFLHEFTYYEAAYQAARAYVLATFQQAETAPLGGYGMSPLQMARVRQCSTWLHKTAYQVISFCHTWGGSHAVRNGSKLNRIYRDMSVAIDHLQFDPISLVEAGPPILGSWDNGMHATVGTPLGAPDPVVAP